MAQPPHPPTPEELIDEAGEESFPASDAPSWTATSHVGAPSHRPKVAEHGRELRASLRADVERLARGRSGRSGGIGAMEDLVAASMLAAGRSVMREPIDPAHRVHNIESELPGVQPRAPAVIVAARYDRPEAGGIVMLLAALRDMAESRTRRPVRFAALASDSAAQAYADRLRAEGARVRGMLSLSRLDFARAPRRAGVLFVGDLRAAPIVRAAREAFRGASRIPARGLWLPGWLARSTAPDVPLRLADWPVVAMRQSGWQLKAGHPLAEPDIDRMAAAVPGLVAAVVRLAGGRV